MKPGKGELDFCNKIFDALLEQPLLGIIIIHKYNVVYCNKAFSKMTGYSIEEIMKIHARDVVFKDILIHPDDKLNATNEIGSILVYGQNGDSRLMEFRGKRKSGETSWVCLYVKNVIISEENFTLLLATDITNLKEIELKLIAKEQQLREALTAKLSTGEKKVLYLLGQGMDPREIARELEIEDNTVYSYIHNMKLKLNLRRTGELYIFAAKFMNSHRNGF